MKYAFLATLAIVLMAETSYGITITAGTSAPGTDVLVSQAAINDSSDMSFRTSNHQWFAQTWTAPSTGIVDKISFAIFQEDTTNRMTSGMNLKVDLWTAATINSSSGSSLLGGGEVGVSPAFNKGQLTWLTFDISNQSVTNGNTYGLTIDFANLQDHDGTHLGGHLIGGDSPAGVQFWNAGGDQYVSGRGFRFATNIGAEDDLAFVIQYAVPEPSSFVLTGMGLVGLIGYVARGRRSRV